MKTPNYKKIYTDIIEKKYPHRRSACEQILNKETLSVLDVMELNRKIFSFQDRNTQDFNQKHRAYGKSDIMSILRYQKENNLNNSQLASHFKLSRNTVAKWKKLFQI